MQWNGSSKLVSQSITNSDKFTNFNSTLYRKAADQGHPHASYNLAVGHLKGLRTDILKKGLAHNSRYSTIHYMYVHNSHAYFREPHTLIKHAASEGVKEADHVLNNICTRGGCE